VRSAKPHIVLIDGKSGAGKTQLATVMSAATGATVVHLDDVYPGWNGLVAGRDQVIESVLVPLSQGHSGGFVSWDWATDQPGERVPVEPVSVVIIEGCGISTPASRELADVVLWVECPDSVRADRLRSRDGDRFDGHLAGWDAQVDAHILSNCPDTTASVVVRTITGQPVGG